MTDKKESSDSLETFELKEVIRYLTENLKYALYRLNEISHTYKDTDFKRVEEAIRKGEQSTFIRKGNCCKY